MATAAALEPATLALFPEDEPLFEIIDGQRVELPPMSAYAVRIAFRLAFEVNFFARAQDLGEAGHEILVHLAAVQRSRRPDAIFVSYQAWPKGRPQPAAGDAWDVIPDLAVEVISPTDRVEELMAKIDEYFRAGVRLVWVVYPALRVAHVYESWTAIRVLTASDELDGGAVLPGFKLALATLFPESTAD